MPFAPPRYNLVTLKQAKTQVRVDHDLDDVDLDRKRAQASGIVLDYIKADLQSSLFNWVDNLGEPREDKIPPEIVAATLLVVGALYENRDGDVWRSPQPLSQAAMDLLWRHRKPALA